MDRRVRLRQKNTRLFIEMVNILFEYSLLKILNSKHKISMAVLMFFSIFFQRVYKILLEDDSHGVDVLD